MIYEYECPEGHRTEVIKSLPEPDKEVLCRDCQKMAQRVFSAPRLLFGSGYDETVGEYSSYRDKEEKMRIMGIRPKEGCGSLTKVKSHHSIQEERKSKGYEEGGIS